MFLRYLRPGAGLTLAMTVIPGIAYPLIATAVAQTLFSAQASGGLLHHNGVLIGSRLIGQKFDSPQYSWGRPSATSPQAFNGAGSGGSNFGPLNPPLIEKVKTNAKALREADAGNTAKIPVELVTGSASGLDPDISPAASLIAAHRREAVLGFIGEPRVNVLELNLALDQLH
jgi:K+-transporting ATPase ATPase C chain